MHTAGIICRFHGKDTELPTSPSWVLQPSYPGHLLSTALLSLFTLGCSGSGGPPLPASQPEGCMYTPMPHTFTTRFKHNPGWETHLFLGSPSCPGGSQDTKPF